MNQMSGFQTGGKKRATGSAREIDEMGREGGEDGGSADGTIVTLRRGKARYIAACLCCSTDRQTDRQTRTWPPLQEKGWAVPLALFLKRQNTGVDSQQGAILSVSERTEKLRPPVDALMAPHASTRKPMFSGRAWPFLVLTPRDVSFPGHHRGRRCQRALVVLINRTWYYGGAAIYATLVPIHRRVCSSKVCRFPVGVQGSSKQTHPGTHPGRLPMGG